MPYIKRDDGRREALRNGDTALTAGELNYQLFYFIKHDTNDTNYKFARAELYVSRFLGQKPNYQKYNDMTGALLRCYKEVERRLDTDAHFLITLMKSYDDEIAKYEDKKIDENGDVE